MLPLIYTTPAYTIAFVVVVVVTRIPEVISASRWRPQRDPTARKADRGSIVEMSVITGGGVIIACVLAAVWTGAAIPWLRPQITADRSGLSCRGGRARARGCAGPTLRGLYPPYQSHTRRLIPLVF